MKKRKIPKLALNKETLRTLDAERLNAVAGGATYTNCIISDCVCDFTQDVTCFCTVGC